MEKLLLKDFLSGTNERREGGRSRHLDVEIRTVTTGDDYFEHRVRAAVE